MKWTERLDLKHLILLRRSNKCESCQNEFACEIGLKGCWCSSVKISDETREHLRKRFRSCLCRSCLETIEAEIKRTSLENDQ